MTFQSSSLFSLVQIERVDPSAVGSNSSKRAISVESYRGSMVVGWATLACAQSLEMFIFLGYTRLPAGVCYLGA